MRSEEHVSAEVDRINVPPPDVGGIIRRGQQLRRRSRLVMSAMGVGAAALLATGVLAVDGLPSGGQSSDVAANADEVSAEQAGVFVVQEMVDADFYSETVVLDYKGSEASDAGWSVDLLVFRCPHVEGQQDCEEIGAATAVVEQDPDGRLVISDVAGEIPDDARRKLVGRSGSIPSLVDNYSFSTAYVDPGAVFMAHYWTGEIPASPMEGTCTFELIDESGRVRLTKEFGKVSPHLEGARDGFFAMGFPESITDAASANVSCSDWKVTEPIEPSSQG